jgi:UDP-2,3-diacylglucosamine pyrophosphatase LpxH
MTYWVSDLHLDFLKDEEIKEFFQSQNITEDDLLLISGNISVSGRLKRYLELLCASVKC